MVRQWIDNTLPTIYSQFIDDKLDVTMLKHITPRRLNKPVLTTASTTYTNALKAQTNSITTAAAATKQVSKPPCSKPTPHVDIIFDDKEFPLLESTTSTAEAPQTHMTTETPHTAAAISTTNTAPYDYKAEMDRISAVIENKLKQQFETLFTQMEHRIAQMEHRLAQLERRIEQQTNQQAANYAEQQQVNAQNTQQLSWVVDNMQKFFKYTNPSQYTPSPSPFSGDGQA